MAGIGHFVAFGFTKHPPEERMAAIRSAGFDEVMLWWGDEYKEHQGSPLEQWKLAMKHRLKVRTVHYPYALTNSLWLDNLDAQAYEQGLKDGLRLASSLGVDIMVLHSTKGTQPPAPNELGLARLRRVVEVAQEAQVIMALENTRFLQHQQLLFDNIDSPYLGFCFDTGHAKAFTPDQDPLALFGQRLVTTHLTDNFGQKQGDLHLRPGLGNIDFDRLIPRILALKPDISLNLESHINPSFEKTELGLQAYLDASYASISRYRHG